MEIAKVDPASAPLEQLAAILVDVVADGASVGFLHPLDPGEALAWWRGSIGSPGVITFVAREGDGVLGVVQLKPVPFANGAHRADVSKLLVPTWARGRGVARQLMAGLEDEARSRGRWLLVLDTRTASAAEHIYRKWGWTELGIVEDYATDPDGTFAPCTFFTKRLSLG